jgi:hypothetical protein
MHADGGWISGSRRVSGVEQGKMENAASIARGQTAGPDEPRNMRLSPELRELMHMLASLEDQVSSERDEG